MFSPALRHRQKLLAARAARVANQAVAIEGAAPAMPESGPVATEYQQLLAKLHDDLRTLSAVQSIEKRIAMKPGLLDFYRPWIAGALETPETDKAPQDEIVVTGMVWALDIGEWDFAFTIARHCILHGLQLPERYNRTLPCLVVEEVAERAIAEPGSVPHAILSTMSDFVKFDMPDQARAKFHRALGESFAREAENFDASADNAMAGGKPALVDAALTELHRAVKLHDKVGSKKQIEQLEREAKKLAAAAGQD